MYASSWASNPGIEYNPLPPMIPISALKLFVLSCSPLFYPAAAQYLIAVVEYRSLAGSDGALRLIETHFRAGRIAYRIKHRGRSLMAIATLHSGAGGPGESGGADTVRLAR